MNCSEAKRFLHVYLDGCLPFPKKTELEEHLELCRNCRNEWLFLQGIVGAIEEEPLIEPSLDFTERVLKKLPVAKRPRAFNLLMAILAGSWLVFAVTAILAIRRYIPNFIALLQRPGVTIEKVMSSKLHDLTTFLVHLEKEVVSLCTALIHSGQYIWISSMLLFCFVVYWTIHIYYEDLRPGPLFRRG